MRIMKIFKIYTGVNIIFVKCKKNKKNKYKNSN